MVSAWFRRPLFRLALAAAVAVAGFASATAPAAATPSVTASVTQAPASADLSSVACSGPAACVAVGDVAAGPWTTRTLAEAWTAGHWRVLPTPSPAATSSYLFGVTCRQSGGCVAVGAAIGGSGGWRALAMAWNGASWRLIPPIYPAGAESSELYGVSCGIPGTCLAVGSYADPGGRTRPLAESLTGGAWRLLRPPAPAGQVTASLNGVSCAGSGCLAVGSEHTGIGVAGVLAEAWTGGAWHLANPPGFGGSSAAAGQDVSCGAPGTCLMVGYAHRTNATAPLPIAEQFAAGQWRAAGHLASAAALLSGVSCPSPARCVAVGNAYGTRRPGPIAQTWNGAAWRSYRPPAPAGPGVGYLSQVACASPDSCLAVGGSYSAAGRRPLAETWNGVDWAMLAEPPA